MNVVYLYPFKFPPFASIIIKDAQSNYSDSTQNEKPVSNFTFIFYACISKSLLWFMSSCY